MGTNVGVLGDIALVRRELRGRGCPHLQLLQVGIARPLVDIAFDVLVVGAMVAWARHAAWAVPLAVLLIGHRQRALGNILHDASHRNLSRRRGLNDTVATLLLAPLLFLDLAHYRAAHFRHHLQLGTEGADPDFMHAAPSARRGWYGAVLHQLVDPRSFRGSVLGHLGDPAVGAGAMAYIIGWWSACLLAVSLLGSLETALFSFGLWMAARASSFHVITTFREMCDHHGLEPGGVYSFTRDITGHGLWRFLVHPRNNAYHLTHHLLPAVPYYRLPQAQRIFEQLPSYQARGVVCRRYVAGSAPVARAWQTGRAA